MIYLAPPPPPPPLPPPPPPLPLPPPPPNRRAKRRRGNRKCTAWKHRRVVPHRYGIPHHMRPFNSRSEGWPVWWMTWRATSTKPCREWLRTACSWMAWSCSAWRTISLRAPDPPARCARSRRCTGRRDVSDPAWPRTSHTRCTESWGPRIGPGRYCSPRRPTIFILIARCEWQPITWRAISARPCHPTHFEPSSLEWRGTL